MLCWFWKASLRERNQEADQEECESTMYYRSWTRPNIKKLKGWQKIGRHGERWHTNLLTEKMATDDVVSEWRTMSNKRQLEHMDCDQGHDQNILGRFSPPLCFFPFPFSCTLYLSTHRTDSTDSSCFSFFSGMLVLTMALCARLSWLPVGF